MTARRQGKSERYFARPLVQFSGARERGEHIVNVLRVVSEVCSGGQSYSPGSDLASDIVARLWAKGGFRWDLDEVRAYASGAVRKMISQMKAAKTRPFADYEDDEGRLSIVGRMVSGDCPHRAALASEAIGLLKHLPAEQAAALAILVDGGSPIDVAVEMKIEIREAVLLVNEARRNIHLVANDDDI